MMETGKRKSQEERVRLHAIVHGIVQGVNFRYYTRLRAETFGLSGWVANRSDGTVEVVAEGPRSAVEALLQFLQQGPPAARVDYVETYWERPTGEFRGFRIRYEVD
ncbi:MAG: acylphosphatase [Anaerolineae bacterium]|nr:acylphosphatase [Anaerolineae bacterium]